MLESQLGALFNEIAESEPVMSQIDPQLAHRRGRTRLRRRMAGLAGTPVLAAAVVMAVALTAGAAKPQSATRPAAGPTAQSQFSPLVPYLSFGWLPDGLKLVDGDILPQVVSIDGGQQPLSTDNWSVSVYAAGECQLTTTQTKSLKCGRTVYDITAKIDGRAPDVNGRHAFWSSSNLVWQYTQDGWAILTAPNPHGLRNGPKLTPGFVHDAIKIASNVQYGKPTPQLLFPVQLTGLPSDWQVGSVFYVPKDDVLTPLRFGLTSGQADPGADGGLEYQKGLPTYDFTPVTSCHLYKKEKDFSDKSEVKTVNGTRVVLTTLPRGHAFSEQLCAADAGGMSLGISVGGKNPPMTPLTLFRDHLKLLGPDPAGWTDKPIG